MNLTKEQLLQNADAMRAFAEGKPIQYRLIGTEKDWTDYGTGVPGPGWLFGEVDYRPKPEPKTRPWQGPADVPWPVCWLRYCTAKDSYQLVTNADAHGIALVLGDERHPIHSRTSWATISNHWLYSTDRERWHKCEVTE